MNNNNEYHYRYDILIVEDSSMICNLLMEVFEKKGFTCLAVESSLDALKELEKNTPKLILLDVHLPDANGYEFCQKIRNTLEIRDIPVFYLTGSPKSEVLEKVQATSANGFISKPFALSDLDVVEQYIKT